MPDVITANRLADGVVVFQSADGSWSEDFNRAAVLADAQWHEATAQAAMIAMGNDYAPLSDMRATSDYRLEAAKNTLYRFWLETRPHNPLAPQAVNVRNVAAETA